MIPVLTRNKPESLEFVCKVLASEQSGGISLAQQFISKLVRICSKSHLWRYDTYQKSRF